MVIFKILRVQATVLCPILIEKTAKMIDTKHRKLYHIKERKWIL